MNQLAVAVLGPDRPGVIAALTEVLLREQGNLEDASMTILREQFAMTLVVSTPATAEEAARDLEEVAARLGLLVSVRAFTGDIAESVDSAPYVVRVHGPDRPGLVHRVASLLATYGVNITDLATRLVGGAGLPVYVMHVSCDVPATCDVAVLGAALAGLADEMSVHATLRPADTDVL